jgi:hypothetical protein
MSLKISDLEEATDLRAASSVKADFMVAGDGVSNKISLVNLKKSIVNNYPYNDAVELNYSWDDIKDMCTTGKFERDIRIGDYKTITLSNGEKAAMEVAGVNTYSAISGNHIDFISKDCLKDTVKWNEAGHNNGTEDSPVPMIASSLYTYLNETIYGYLPDDVKAVIVDRYDMCEMRYTSGSKSMSTSNGTIWANLGKIWLPSEVEVYGHVVWGTEKYTEGYSVQYPIFRDGWSRRVKGSGYNGGRCSWWLRCASSGGGGSACSVSNSGDPATAYVANLAIRVPLCFRVAA